MENKPSSIWTQKMLIRASSFALVLYWLLSMRNILFFVHIERAVFLLPEINLFWSFCLVFMLTQRLLVKLTNSLNVCIATSSTEHLRTGPVCSTDPTPTTSDKKWLYNSSGMAPYVPTPNSQTWVLLPKWFFFFSF